MHWQQQPNLFFSRLWMYLGAHFYVIAALLILFSVPTNLAALIDPGRILLAFQITADADSLWFRYIRIRAVVAFCVIFAFAFSLIANRALQTMTYVTIGYLLLYLLIDIVTVSHFGQMTSTVWLLFGARLLVAVLVCISVEQYFDSQRTAARAALQIARH